MPKLMILILVLLASVAGCHPAAESEGDSGKRGIVTAGDGHWRLVSIGGEPVEVPGGEEMAPRLTISPGGDLSGFGGCNKFSGRYELDGDRLSIGPIASTKMACPRIGDLERQFFAAISDTAGYRIEGEALALLDEDGRELARLELATGPVSKQP